ncbi:hypothetical protein [Nocardioides sp. 1609]|uniref:hypothetical protein n=1 Tax=Nocardioides sp. 1609 TaxID=2508327 RepID=UPI00142FE9B9|nr:hypothetical protein [Nocardioides sp. 1609]
MSETSNDEDQAAGNGRTEQQQEIADVQEQLDAESEGEGLANESDRGEPTGLSQG